jgi:hypothetical protein
MACGYAQSKTGGCESRPYGQVRISSALTSENNDKTTALPQRVVRVSDPVDDVATAAKSQQKFRRSFLEARQ